jgi:hypothetical protein
MKARSNPRLNSGHRIRLRRAEQAYQLLATMSPGATFVSYGLLCANRSMSPRLTEFRLCHIEMPVDHRCGEAAWDFCCAMTLGRHSGEDGLEVVATELVAARVLRFIAQPPHDLGGFADVRLAQIRAHRRGHFK